MNSLILCEGKTDCILLQYYLEKVYGWERDKKSSFQPERNSWSNQFRKNENVLIISETKGCDNLAKGLVTAVKRNENIPPGSREEYFDKILIFTDNDEVNTGADMICKIKNELQTTSISFLKELEKNKWNECEIQAIEGAKKFDLYIMLIPFDENGALETYLLACIGNHDGYDKKMIDEGNAFVDTVDPDRRYLSQRRLMTKAKFDVYFSIRTSVDQFPERQNILKSVAWEEYDKMREDFKIFADLG